MTKETTIDTFLPYCGDEFLAQDGDGGQVAFQLLKAVPTGYSSPSTGARAPFSLLFEVKLERGRARQALYTLKHEVVGEMEMFLVPVGVRDGLYEYEAVFS